MNANKRKLKRRYLVEALERRELLAVTLVTPPDYPSPYLIGSAYNGGTRASDLVSGELTLPFSQSVEVSDANLPGSGSRSRGDINITSSSASTRFRLDMQHERGGFYGPVGPEGGFGDPALANTSARRFFFTVDVPSTFQLSSEYSSAGGGLTVADIGLLEEKESSGLIIDFSEVFYNEQVSSEDSVRFSVGGPDASGVLQPGPIYGWLARGGIVGLESDAGATGFGFAELLVTEASDLSGEVLVAPAQASVGDTVETRVSIVNGDAAPVTSPFTVAYALERASSQPIELGQFLVDTHIDANGSTNVSRTLQIPDMEQLQEGEYQLVARIDSSNAIAELDETNNQIEAPITISRSALPDYRLTAVENVNLSIGGALQAADASLDANFEITNPNGQPFTIAAYWSIDDKLDIGDAPAGSVVAEATGESGTEKIVINQDGLLTGQKYLLVVANPFEESSENVYDEGNVKSLALPPVFQSVSSTYDDKNSKKTCAAEPSCSFGPFIANVPLTSGFTVKVSDQGVGKVTSVSAKLVGVAGDAVPATKSEGGWKFTFENMELTADTKVLVTARTDLGVERTFEFELDVIELDFELLVGMPTSVGLGEADLTPDEVRIISGFEVSYPVKATLTSDGTPLDEIPFQDDGDPYDISLKLNTLTDSKLADFEQTFVTGSVADASLAAEATQFAIDAGGTVLSTTELFVIDLPGWVGDPTAKRFNFDTQAYEIDFGYGFDVGTEFFGTAVLPSDLPIPSDALDLLDNRAAASIDLSLDVPVRLVEEAEAIASKFKVETTLLGKPILDQEISLDHGSNFTVSLPNLDSKTLKAGTLRVSAGNVLPDDLGGWDLFGDVGLNGVLPSDSLAFIQDVADVAVLNTGVFFVKANVGVGPLKSDLTLGFGLEVGLENGKLKESGTYLDFEGSSTATIKAGLEAGLGFSFGGITLSLASLEANVDASLTGRFDSRIEFGGDVTNPTLSSEGSNADLGVTSKLDLTLTNKLVGLETGSKKFPVFSTPTSNVFGNTLSANLEDNVPTNAFENASFQSSLGDVKPVDGDSFLTLGDPNDATSSSDPTEPFSSRVRLQSTTPGTVDSIGYQLNVLSNSSDLSPDTHFLETVLKGSEVLVSRIDLSELPQSESTNPLGFASGWTAVSDSPDDSVEFFKLYNLEFRLITDSSANERVAVALDGLEVVDGQPSIQVTAPTQSTQSGVIVPVDLFDELPVAIVQLQNVGRANGMIDRIEIEGDGLALVGPDLSGSTLYARDQATTLMVKVLNPLEPASGLLKIVTDDPTHPVQSFSLEYQGSGVRLLGDTLQMVGTNESDRFRVEQKSGALVVSGNGLDAPLTFNADDVASIQVVLGAGNDRLVIRNTDVNARVSGGEGDDYLETASGNDFVEDALGNNTVVTGPGDDEILTGAGNDRVIAGRGHDSVDVGDGFNRVFAGSGDDVVVAGADRDVISGDAGDDVIVSGGGSDLVFAGRGADVISGGAGNDILHGGSGRDLLLGGVGRDWLFGGQGRDLLIAGIAEYQSNPRLLDAALRSWVDDDEDRVLALIGPQTDDDDADRLFGGLSDDLLWYGVNDKPIE